MNSEYVSLISSDDEDMKAFMTSEYDSDTAMTDTTNPVTQSESEIALPTRCVMH